MEHFKKIFYTIYKKSGLLAVIALCFMVIGCASKTTKVEQYSGFLSDYSQLEKRAGLDGGVVLSWVSPVLAERKYTKVMIDPVAGPQLRSEVLTSILVYLNKAIRQEVGKTYEIVSEPGRDVVRIRAAITGIRTPLEELAVYEYVPIALAFAGVSSATGKRDEAVEVFVEAEMSDSLSNERLAAAVRKGFGESVEDRDDQVELENVRPVLDGWAQATVRLLDLTIK